MHAFQLLPNVRDLRDTMERMSSLPVDFAPKLKVKEWQEKLLSMRASDELDAEQARQMAFDLEHAYTEFSKHLHDQ